MTHGFPFTDPLQPSQGYSFTIQKIKEANKESERETEKETERQPETENGNRDSDGNPQNLLRNEP